MSLPVYLNPSIINKKMEIERTKERKTFTTRIKTNKKVILLTMIWEVKKERKKKKVLVDDDEVRRNCETTTKGKTHTF